ncbi:hypothetical protein B0T25DRAFT_565392 [Lasiosphaeria hispida]|uniref:Integral membrane protein n=1 Tax=Lasiosphaeria hispida TaxID=260671 RepID=A0AAJ0HSR1_9PEZI|nr:hypothetical protein B0T25DRAFT_565392 [Lasiosphaeria hispida]
MDLASFYFGAFLGVFVFTFAKVLGQTRLIWKRTRTLANFYLCMLWIEAWVNMIFALITFFLAFYLGIVALWATQTQLLTQIIANRVSLIMVDRHKARTLRWGLFSAIGCVNVAVGIIWTRAHLPSATPAQKHLNLTFERAEKSFFLVIDLGLNLFFLYLVRFRLIAEGLTKYWRLYNFNATMVGVSTSMDVLLLGFLSLTNSYLYVQFAPLAYIVKLYIEITIAILISKVARSGATSKDDGLYAKKSGNFNPSRATSSVTITGGRRSQIPSHAISRLSARDVDIEACASNDSSSETDLVAPPNKHSILRTIETTVQNISPTSDQKLFSGEAYHVEGGAPSLAKSAAACTAPPAPTPAGTS